MGWRSLEEFIRALEIRGELLRVGHPVDLRFEAGCIADLWSRWAVQLWSSINPDLRMAALADSL